MSRLLLLAPLLALAGCGSIDISADGNNVSIHSNLSVAEEDLDLNGVKLYPGSVVRDFKLDARDVAGTDDDKAHVAIQFDAPAPVETVRAWFRKSLAENGYSVTDTPKGFAASRGVDDHVAVELDADGTGRTKGHMNVGT